jgi:hypothetical protein
LARREPIPAERSIKMKNKIERMKEKVREDFAKDSFSTLIGFLRVENDVVIPGCHELSEGKTLVVYLAHTGGVTYEDLKDMYNNICNNI